MELPRTSCVYRLVRVRTWCAIVLALLACGTQQERPAADPTAAAAEPSSPLVTPVAAPSAHGDAATPSAAPAVAHESSSALVIPATATGVDAELMRKAEAARQAGDPQGMRKALMELVRDHPTSPFVPYGYFAFGEFHFAEGNMDDASRFFEKAAMFPDSDVVPFALHRLAWCHMNLRADEAALENFLGAIKGAQRLPPERGRPLAIASVFDSVEPFVRIATLAKAPAFYTRVIQGTGLELDAVLERVAAAAIDSGRGDELAKVCSTSQESKWCERAAVRP